MKEKERSYMREYRREYRKKRDEMHTCKVCKLTYPYKEMKGDICYLCKEDKPQ